MTSPGTNFEPKTLGLFLHVLDEFGAHDGFGKPGVVLDVRGDRELSARFQAFENNGSEIGAGGVDGGRVCRRSRIR